MIERNTIISSIDHSVLRPNLKEDEVIHNITSVVDLRVASFCVMPSYLKLAEKLLIENNSNSALSTVIGFPHGNNLTLSKLDEIEKCAEYNVREYDVVVNFSNVLSGKWSKVASELEEIFIVCATKNALLKVIFETCYLEDRHIVTLCEICADIMSYGYVKTSTGFGSAGATPEHIRLMKKHSSHLGVKASGGIKTLSQVETLLECGASRIGATATLGILAEYDRIQELIKAGKPRDSDEPPF